MRSPCLLVFLIGSFRIFAEELLASLCEYSSPRPDFLNWTLQFLPMCLQADLQQSPQAAEFWKPGHIFLCQVWSYKLDASAAWLSCFVISDLRGFVCSSRPVFSWCSAKCHLLATSCFSKGSGGPCCSKPLLSPAMKKTVWRSGLRREMNLNSEGSTPGGAEDNEWPLWETWEMTMCGGRKEYYVKPSAESSEGNSRCLLD